MNQRNKNRRNNIRHTVTHPTGTVQTMTNEAVLKWDAEYAPAFAPSTSRHKQFGVIYAHTTYVARRDVIADMNAKQLKQLARLLNTTIVDKAARIKVSQKMADLHANIIGVLA